jgi:hypothetical protein
LGSKLAKQDGFQEILKEVELLMASLSDPETKKVLNKLLNLVETIHSESEELKKENQQLKDEVSYLKGEQKKPDIKGKNQKNEDISSEQERKNKGTDDEAQKEEPKTRNREPKLPRVKIDREELCPVDKSILPEDRMFKGYSDVVIQDIKIVTDNVKYRREIYYSPSMNKTYLGDLPSEVAGKGEYGVGVRSLIPLLKSECNLSESCILDFFQNFGIVLSSAYISNQWTKGYKLFHQEKADIFKAGLLSGHFQQIDDTGARVNGENHYTQILCNPLYSAYFTTPKKDRLTVLDVFRNFAPREFLYNHHAVRLLMGFHLSQKIVRAVDQLLEKDSVFDEATFDSLLNTINPGSTQRSRIKEACAIAAYHEQTDFPIIQTLVCDDAPQFKLLTKELALCWIHDGRHYKKLHPVVPLHQSILDDFLSQYWIFYHKLIDYQEDPNPTKISLLTQDFDVLFSTQTEYEQLNDRIAKTRAKKQELLLVLKHPDVPLHNNASELAARVQARARDVSLHTRSKEGTRIKDTFMTISQTAKKLKIRTYEYIRDRVSGEFKLPSLAQLIAEKATT